MAKKSSPRTSRTHLPAQSASSLKRLKQISHLLDNAIKIPFTKYRFGLDPILGLIPGGGDMAGGLMSVYIVFEAARMGVPAETLGKMGLNIVFDLLAGTVPVLGDLVDVAWKANSQNVSLLEAHVAALEPARVAAPENKLRQRLVAVAVILALIALILGMAALSVWVATSLWNLIF